MVKQSPRFIYSLFAITSIPHSEGRYLIKFVLVPVLLLPLIICDDDTTVYFILQQEGRGKVIVMELCTGGSLFNILDDPENSYGLEEGEFLLVLSHLG